MHAKNVFHWQARIYADIDIIAILEHPPDISGFNDFIKVSRQSGITPVVESEFAELRIRKFRFCQGTMAP